MAWMVGVDIVFLAGNKGLWTLLIFKSVRLTKAGSGGDLQDSSYGW
jgi:hypothetical protein